MSDDVAAVLGGQPGPPTEEAKERRDIEWMRITQLRFLEGYRARLAEPHPMRRNAKGEELHNREQKWSFAEMAEARCPGKGTPDVTVERKSFGVSRLVDLGEPAWPAHERERWIAGFLHADNLGATLGSVAMERGDPSKPQTRRKAERVAEPIEAFPEAIFDRAQLRERKAADERRRERDLHERRP